MQLDYTIESVEERLKLVEQILEKEENPNLEYLANYLIIPIEKEERKQRKILTDNRMATIDKRETSFEGLVDKMESGENALYHIQKADKNILFQPKAPITKQDYKNHPELQQIKDCIAELKKLVPKTGRDRYLIKKASIELYKDLYLTKKCLEPPVMPTIHIGSKFDKRLEGLSFQDPIVIEALLTHYSDLKQDSWGRFDGDLWYIMQDFDNLLDKALSDNPYYETIVRMKIDGRTNQDIRDELQLTLGVTPTPEYISTLWRNRIPKHIAEVAHREYLDWYFTYVKPGKWKKCSRCKEIKLANNIFFSKNKSSKDGWYSMCKSCRNKKK